MEMMKKGPVLCVLAAGMGSRFGGLKQIQQVDEQGHSLMDYAIYDAKKAGFSEVVFIIREEFADAFQEAVGNRVAEKMPVSYVFQALDKLPAASGIPEGREKPWGTTHAIWCAADALRGKDFVTINADDFYGFDSFRLAAAFSAENGPENEFACIGYDVVKTLSPSGTVSRGICRVDAENRLVRIDERKEIKLENGCGFYTLDGGETYQPIEDGSVASMNMWVFRPGFIRDIEKSFPERFDVGVKANPLKFEETLSDAVQNILNRNEGSVKIIPTGAEWFGMTYPEDLPGVKAKLAEMTQAGEYPADKW